MEIRLAEEQDALNIAKLHVETWQYAYRGQVPDSYIEGLPQSVAERVDRWKKTIGKREQGLKVFVAEISQLVVGFCFVNSSRDDDLDDLVGEVGAIYVKAQLMGQGIGTALLEAGLSSLKVEGFKKATLWVLKSHTKSRNWYERKGWQLEGKGKTEERGEIVLELVRYVIDL